jgi:hypothetical protein
VLRRAPFRRLAEWGQGWRPRDRQKHSSREKGIDFPHAIFTEPYVPLRCTSSSIFGPWRRPYISAERETPERRLGTIVERRNSSPTSLNVSSWISRVEVSWDYLELWSFFFSSSGSRVLLNPVKINKRAKQAFSLSALLPSGDGFMALYFTVLIYLAPISFTISFRATIKRAGELCCSCLLAIKTKFRRFRGQLAPERSD